MGNYEEAISSFKEQRNIAAELGSSRHIAMANCMLGNVSKRLKQYDEAGDYYDRALTIATELSLKNLLGEFLFEKAEMLFEHGRADEASPLTEEAIQISEAVGRKDFLFKARILQQRIVARSDAAAAAAALEKMLAECRTNDETANIYYYLSEFTKDSSHRDKALELYETIFKTAPRAEYRDRISVLKNG
jgi:tetratricopeptide (TPR) repeat protein